jgi:hypothetical protein
VQQPCGISRPGRMLRDASGRQREIEVAEMHPAYRDW